ncbi:hypothetical protein INR49_006039 [Caranx melampygus]|nr:hypothetical protein INR49_006039 [Caranx melampygus]
MATQRVLPQSKETLLQNYNKRLKDDIRSILDNFTEIIKTAKIEDETQVSRATQAEQDHYEMHVRAANIVRAGESLMKLVSDLKQFLILNDFPSVNDAITTVSGTALICHCVRPTGSETVGPPQAVAAVLPRATKKTWTDLPHRRQTPNTTSTDTELPLLTNNEEENCILTGIHLCSVWTTVFG